MNKNRSFRWRRIGLTALFLLFFDGFFVGIPAFGAFVCLLMIVASGLSALLCLFKNREMAGQYGSKAAIYLLTLGAILIVFATNTKIGSKNAGRLVAAVSAYHADHGKYPAALDHLVPDYLTDIPLCAYRITESRYKYIADPTQPMLVWVKTPPFGQNIYHFDSKSWTYVD